jgi:hypothetical protein
VPVVAARRPAALPCRRQAASARTLLAITFLQRGAAHGDAEHGHQQRSTERAIRAAALAGGAG